MQPRQFIRQLNNVLKRITFEESTPSSSIVCSGRPHAGETEVMLFESEIDV